MFEGFRRGLRRLLGAERPEDGRTTPGVAQEQGHREGRLKIRQESDQVLLVVDHASEPMLVLPGSLDGTLSSVRSQVAGRDVLVLSFPVQVAGQRRNIQVTVARHGSLEPGPEFSLIRASRRRVPPADQALEFVYAHEDSQLRYLVEMDLEIPPVGFREFTKNRAVFEEVPPVAQMVAFLKATLHQRRTTLRSLSAMVRRVADPRVRQTVAVMEEMLSQSHDFSNPYLLLLQADLNRLGRTVNTNTTAALCLLADISLGELTHASVEALVDGAEPIQTSLVATEAVAAFLGVSIDSAEWRDNRPELDADGFRLAEETTRFMREAVGRRTTLTILADLAEDSGSERSRSRVQRLAEKVPQDQVLTNDETDALRLYLMSIGRSVQPDTLAALGIYVDFEAGILSEEDIDRLTPQRGFVDTSLYGMVAISGAFDAELRPYRLQAERTSLLWEGLIALFSAVRGGIVARFLEPDQPGYLTLCVVGPDQVEELRGQGLTFTGEVLAQIPMLDQLQEEDLSVLAAARPGLLACFLSEDKRVQWRRLDSVVRPLESTRMGGRYDFIDGYHLVRFHSRVAAWLEPLVPGSEAGQVLVFRDQRGNAHFHHATGPAPVEPPPPGLEPAREMVQFPPLPESFPVLYEPSHDFLLGRPEERGLKQQRLDRIYSGLESHLTRPWRWYNLEHHPHHLARLRAQLKQPAMRALLVGIVDVATRNALINALMGQGGQRVDLSVAEPVLQCLDLADMVDLGALLVLHQMCLDSELPGQRKYYNRVKFRELLLDRLFALADSSDLTVRWLAVRLMGTELVSLAPQQQLAVSYVMSRSMENDRPLVAAAAARSLAALSLEDLVALPAVVQANLSSTQKRRTSKKKKGRGVEALEVQELAQELTDWLQGAEAEEHPLAGPLRRGELAQELTVWLTHLNEAFREDTSLAEHRYLLLLEETLVEQLLAASVQAWRALATQQKLSLRELFKSDGVARLRQGFQELLASGWESQWPAWLGGADQPLRVFHLEPSQAASVRDREGLSPLFQDLAARHPSSGGPPLRLVRWLPQPEQLAHLGELGPVFNWALPLYAEDLLLFRMQQQRFIPLYDRDTPLRRDAAMEKDLRILAGVARQAIEVPEPVAPLEGTRSVRSADLEGLSVLVAGVFNIPIDSLPMIQTMLSGLLPRYERLQG